jgi:hypothetical protein
MITIYKIKPETVYRSLPYGAAGKIGPLACNISYYPLHAKNSDPPFGVASNINH